MAGRRPGRSTNPGTVLVVAVLFGVEALSGQSGLRLPAPVAHAEGRAERPESSGARAQVRPGEAYWQTLYLRTGAAPHGPIDVRAVGDVMLGRGVAAMIRYDGPALIRDDVGRLLDGDVTIGNLESPLAEPLRPKLGPPLLTAPRASLAALESAGFDALSLANNHSLDAGLPGVETTFAALNRLSISPLGLATEGAAPAAAGREEHHARSTARRRMPHEGARSSTLSLLAFAEAGLARSGDGARVLTLGEAALAAVRAERRHSEHVVVLVHWGEEYAARPSDRQRGWAQRLAAAGADLIVGSHPHVLQGVDVVHSGPRSTLVAYSLGNFIFDQAGVWADDAPTGVEPSDTSVGAVLRVALDRGGVAGAWAAPTALRGGRVIALVPGSREHAAAMSRLGEP